MAKERGGIMSAADEDIYSVAAITDEGYLVVKYPITSATNVRLVPSDKVADAPAAIKLAIEEFDKKATKYCLRGEIIPNWDQIDDILKSGAIDYVPPNQKYCSVCSSDRIGDTCFKCGNPTFTPAKGWVSPATPDVERIRAAAKVLGYAIGEHGTKQADLDLIAMPWVADAVLPRKFVFELATSIGARVLETEDKPHGRFAATLQMVEGYFKPIDLSVMIGKDPVRLSFSVPANGIMQIDGVQHKVLGWEAMRKASKG